MNEILRLTLPIYFFIYFGLTFVLKSVGFFKSTSVAKSPPNDCPIIVLSLFVLYLVSI